MTRYEVTIKIAVSAENEQEAREKVKAMLTTGVYKDTYVTPNFYGTWDKMQVKKLAF